MRPSLTWISLALLPLLVGCSLLGGSRQPRNTIYAPQTALSVESSTHWPQVSWQLGIAPPTAERLINSTRIAVRPTPEQLQVYSGAVWSTTAPDMLETSVLRVLEDSGKIPSVARLSRGLLNDYRLLLDIRRFEADYAGQALPTATIEVQAKLLSSHNQRIVADKRFIAQVSATQAAVPQVAIAFEQALNQVSNAIAGWTLQTGQDQLDTRGSR